DVVVVGDAAADGVGGVAREGGVDNGGDLALVDHPPAAVELTGVGGLVPGHRGSLDRGGGGQLVEAGGVVDAAGPAAGGRVPGDGRVRDPGRPGEVVLHPAGAPGRVVGDDRVLQDEPLVVGDDPAPVPLPG